MSLAGRPSNVGTRFHTLLSAELDLDFVYKAFTTTDLAAGIELVDEVDGSAEAIGSVNTIVNTNGSCAPTTPTPCDPVGMLGGDPAADDLPVALEVVDALSTGIRPSDDQVRRASEFSRVPNLSGPNS